MSAAKKSILIVDDSYPIRHRIRAMLDAYSEAVVRDADSYASALDILRSYPVSVAVLDINLRDGNGIELLKYIRQHYPSVPVIMMSNQSGELYRSRCRALGASYFIDKSVDFDLLPPLIQSML